MNKLLKLFKFKSESPEIVRFTNGLYAVRKGNCPENYKYLDGTIDDPAYWFSISSDFFRCVQFKTFTEAELRLAKFHKSELKLIPDYGIPTDKIKYSPHSR